MPLVPLAEAPEEDEAEVTDASVTIPTELAVVVVMLSIPWLSRRRRPDLGVGMENKLAATGGLGIGVIVFASLSLSSSSNSTKCGLSDSANVLLLLLLMLLFRRPKKRKELC